MPKSFAKLFLVAAFALFTLPAFAAMVDLPNQGFQWPPYTNVLGTMEDGINADAVNLSASNLKTSFCGRLYQNDPTFRAGSSTKDIQSITWVSGSKSGTWTLQISLQGMTVAAGPPIQPDGTIKGIANAAFATTLSTAVVANAVNTTANFGANDTGIHYGDARCIVFEFSAYTSGASHVIGAGISTDPAPWGPFQSNWGGASWAPRALSGGGTVVPNILINFSDGTVGGFSSVIPWGFVSSPTEVLNTASSPREIGWEFQTPFNVQINKLCGDFSTANGSSNFTLELTDKAGTPNILATINLLGAQGRAAGAFQGAGCFPTLVGGVPTRITITRNTSYVVGVLGTSASPNNLQIFTQAVSSTASLDLFFGCGRKCGRVTRSVGGAWSALSTTQMPLLGVGIVAIDTNTGP